MWDYDDERDSKRTLTERQRKILYKYAHGRCQNPACNRKIDFVEMLVGHKTAWSKGGSTTLRNLVCLCYKCNKLQGTKNWTSFLKKQGVMDPKTKLRKSLNALTIIQLRYLAKKHKIVLRGQTEESLFTTRRIAPTKSQYVSRLFKIVTQEELSKVPKIIPQKIKRRRQREEPFSFW